MKKMISIICVVAMFFCFAPTAGASELDFIMQEYSNYDSTIEYSVKVNKPLDILSFLNEEAGVDVQYIVEELLKSIVIADLQCEVSEDYLTGKIYAKYNLKLPVNISEDLKFAADLTGHMWMEYDLTSVENAKCVIIFKNPLKDEYIYIDMFDPSLTGAAEEAKTVAVESIHAIDLKEAVKELRGIVEKEYKEHAVIAKTEDGYTKISFTNDSLIDFAVDYFVGIMDSDYMKNALMAEGISVTGFDADEAAINDAKSMIKSLSLFSDEDAFVIKYKTDENGLLTDAEETVRIQFNIYDLAKTMEASDEDLYPITKENSDVDITFVTKATYRDINSTVVKMPTLTEENSTSFMDLIMGMIYGEDYTYDDDYYYDEDSFVEYEYQSEKFWDYARGRMDRGGMYVHMEEFLESAYWDDDNLAGEVALEGDNVTIALTSDVFGGVVIKGNLREDSYFLNDTQLWGRKPFVVVEEYNWNTYAADKKVYVNMDVLDYVLGAKVESMEIYLMDENGISLTDPEYYFDIVRPNKGYVEQGASVGIIGGADGPTAIFVTE